MIENYDFASSAAIVQHWWRTRAKNRVSDRGCR
jgi:hypothetical protein